MSSLSWTSLARPISSTSPQSQCGGAKDPGGVQSSCSAFYMIRALYSRPTFMSATAMSSFKGDSSSSAGSDYLGFAAHGHATGGPSLGRALTKEELERAARSRERALAKRAEAKRKQGAPAVGVGSDGGWVSVKKPAADAEAVRQSVACYRRFASSQQFDPLAVVKEEKPLLEDYNAPASNMAREGAHDEGKPAPVGIKTEGGAKKEEEFLFVLGSDNKGMAVSTAASGCDSLAGDAPRKPAAPMPPSEAQLSEQQMAVLKAVGQGKSVFLTGSAGTGKSFLLAYAIRLLRTMHGTDAVHVTASTGIAACAIGGSTLHSFAGIGLGEGNEEVLLAKVKSRRELRRRWETAKALVIDEISMIDGPLLDKLDYIGRNTRNFSKHKPFGGIQLLVTGDFFQLPPVAKGKQELSFAFEAKCWSRCFHLQLELTRVFRQIGSQTFVDILNEVRRGHLSDRAAELLSQRINATVAGCSQDGIIATKLYPYRMDVAKENYQRLMELKEEEFTYVAVDRAVDDHAQQLLEHTRAEKRLVLKKGAQVMLLKNLDTSLSLVNGSRGMVVDFVDPTPQQQSEQEGGAKGAAGKTVQYWPLVKFVEGGQTRVMEPETWKLEKNGREVASRLQVPLTLAWALSVHKCQGMTLDRVDTNLSRAFDYGMVYVALSRVRSLEGLHLSGFDPRKIRVHEKVAAFYEDLQKQSSCVQLDGASSEKEGEYCRKEEEEYDQ